MVLGISTGGSTVSIIIRAIDQFSTTLDSAKLSFKDLSRQARLTGFALTGLGVAGALGLKQLVDAAAGFEQTQIAFNTLLGDTQKAQKLLKKLSDFAKKTPFTLPGVERSARQLLAVGFEADELIPTLKAVGDVASGLGLGEEGLQRLILNLGQVRTQGKLTGRELRDFAVAGVPILDELAKNLGITTKEVTKLISEGSISSEDVVKAFDTMSSAGGRFADLMIKQAATTAGRISNLKDSIILLARDMGKVLLPAANKIINVLKKIVDLANEHPTISKFALAAVALGTAFALVVGPGLLIVGFLPSLIGGFKALNVVLNLFNLTLGRTALLILPITVALFALADLIARINNLVKGRSATGLKGGIIGTVERFAKGLTGATGLTTNIPQITSNAITPAIASPITERKTGFRSITINADKIIAQDAEAMAEALAALIQEKVSLG